jgi:transcriptional regulator with XRE-family HTH domain
MLLTLDNLRPLRIARTLKRQHLAALADMTVERLTKIEQRELEPWFDETILLARGVGAAGILPLLPSGDLTLSEMAGGETPHDLELWRSGRRAPLSLALRITLRFGLTDPMQLHVSPIQRQIWQMIESGDRSVEAPGWCPWCGVDRLADATGARKPHLPTCLPNNLWAPNDIPTSVEPLKPMVKRAYQQSGKIAYGLKALRIARGLSQVQAAAGAGVVPNHYARIERGELKLMLKTANTLAAFYGVDRETLYIHPQ